jgi:hypothetical protein
MQTSKSYPKQTFKQLSHRIVPLVLQRHDRNCRSRATSCSSSLQPGSAPSDDDGGEEEEDIGEASDEPPHNRKSQTNESSSFLFRAVGGRVQSLILILIASSRWKSGKRRSSPSSRCVLGPAFPDPSDVWPDSVSLSQPQKAPECGLQRRAACRPSTDERHKEIRMT